MAGDSTVYGELAVQGLTMEKLARYVADLTDGHDHDGVNSKSVSASGTHTLGAGQTNVADGVDSAADEDFLVYDTYAGEWRNRAIADTDLPWTGGVTADQIPKFTDAVGSLEDSVAREQTSNTIQIYVPGDSGGAWFEVLAANDSSGNWAGMGVTEYGAGSAYLWLWTSAGNSGTPAATPSGRDLGVIEWGGWAPTIGLAAKGAAITVTADATWTSSSTPAHITIATVPAGDTAYGDRVVIDNAGGFTIKTDQDVYHYLTIRSEDDASGNGMELSVIDYGPSGAVPAVLIYHVGGDYGSPTATQNTWWLGFLDFGGYGTSIDSGARIVAKASQTWTGSVHGTTLEFQTAANGSTTLTTRILLEADGQVVIGASNPLAAYGTPLTIDGNTLITRDDNNWLALTLVNQDDTGGNSCGIEVYEYGNGDAYMLVASVEGNYDSRSPAASGYLLGGYHWFGWDGAAFGAAARIEAWTSEAWDGSGHGSSLRVSVVKSNTTAMFEALRINNQGQLTAYADLTAIGQGCYTTSGQTPAYNFAVVEAGGTNVDEYEIRIAADDSLIFVPVISGVQQFGLEFGFKSTAPTPHWYFDDDVVIGPDPDDTHVARLRMTGHMLVGNTYAIISENNAGTSTVSMIRVDANDDVRIQGFAGELIIIGPASGTTGGAEVMFEYDHRLKSLNANWLHLIAHASLDYRDLACGEIYLAQGRLQRGGLGELKLYDSGTGNAYNALNFQYTGDFAFKKEGTEMVRLDDTTTWKFAAGCEVHLGISAPTAAEGGLGLVRHPVWEAEFDALEAITKGDCVRLGYSGGVGWLNCNAGDLDTLPPIMVGVAMEDNSGAGPIKVCVFGEFKYTTYAFVSSNAGVALYVPASDGPPTLTAPSGAGVVVQVIGFVVNDDAIFVRPQYLGEDN